jgi:hypothetical protein
MIRVIHPGSRIQGVKKAPVPGSGTLHTQHLIKIISQKHEDSPGMCVGYLVVETELKLGVHGADLDGEDLAGLLPPEQAHLLVHADGVDAAAESCVVAENEWRKTQFRELSKKGFTTIHFRMRTRLKWKALYSYTKQLKEQKLSHWKIGQSLQARSKSCLVFKGELREINAKHQKHYSHNRKEENRAEKHVFCLRKV